MGQHGFRFLFAAVATALALAASGCGSSSCSADNCSGCCDASGACQTASDAACGIHGAACATCSAGQHCAATLGLCEFGGAGGNNGGGNNGGNNSGSGSSTTTPTEGGSGSGSTTATTTTEGGSGSSGSSSTTATTQGNGGSSASTTGTSGSTGSSTTTTGTSGSTHGSTGGGTTGGSTTTTTTGGACTSISNGTAFEFDSNGFFQASTNPNLGGSDADVLSVQLYPGGDTPGSFDLGAGDDANYGSCLHCVLVYADTVDGGILNFFQSGGTLQVNSVDTTAGTVDATLIGVTLQQVDIDSSSFESTPVAGGTCLHIANLAVQVQGSSTTGGTTGSTGDCGSIDGNGICSGQTLEYCASDSSLQTADCPSDYPGSNCTVDGTGYADCTYVDGGSADSAP